MSRIRRALASVAHRLGPLGAAGEGLGRRSTPAPTRHDPTTPSLAQIATQSAYLARVDVSEHNREGSPPTFAQLTSQAASAAQCEDPTYLHWLDVLTGVGEEKTVGNPYNRKTWEWAYIAEAASQAGLLEPGRTALGFGVGNEPLPAFFASRGLTVLATDQATENGSNWAATGELMTGLTGLARRYLISNEDLASRVTLRNVDMNDVPPDLGTFDVVWSSCVIEHLGSPARGLDFVLESCRLLNPGGSRSIRRSWS